MELSESYKSNEFGVNMYRVFQDDTRYINRANHEHQQYVSYTTLPFDFGSQCLLVPVWKMLIQESKKLTNQIQWFWCRQTKTFRTITKRNDRSTLLMIFLQFWKISDFKFRFRRTSFRISNRNPVPSAQNKNGEEIVREQCLPFRNVVRMSRWVRNGI